MYPYMSKPKSNPVENKNTKLSEIPNEVLKDLLTPSEIRMLKNRWLIMQNLANGLSIRSVALKVKVGTDTVVRASKMLQKSRINKILGKRQTVRQFKTQTPWIFGKK